MNLKKIFITGGAGYVGSCLVPELLKKNYEVTVYDIMFFTDNFLPKSHPKLKIIKGDIRDQKYLLNSCKNHDGSKTSVSTTNQKDDYTNNGYNNCSFNNLF